MNIKILNDYNFEKEVLQPKTPVLVEFWASWCPPCKMMEPLLDELAKEFAGRVLVAKLNVDQYRDLAAAYPVMGVPSFFIFKLGKIVSGPHIGAQSKTRLQKIIEEQMDRVG
ncbi:MAG: thioredoxin [Candidatus Omnitrophica bacterium]|nr:thioredoxin [Candidatus Omnitrophota bacterium]